MDNAFANEPMLDIYVYETTQNVEQLEELMLSAEKAHEFTPDAINEVFRIMHTVKGSSAMMMYHDVTSLAHAMEDLMFFIREDKPKGVDFAGLSDLILGGGDFIRAELESIKNGNPPGGDPSALIESIRAFLASLKGQPVNTPKGKPVKKSTKASIRPLNPSKKADSQKTCDASGYPYRGSSNT